MVSNYFVILKTNGYVLKKKMQREKCPILKLKKGHNR